MFFLLEPKAVSNYCQYMHLEPGCVNKSKETLKELVQIGNKYLICDLGGKYPHKLSRYGTICIEIQWFVT